MRREAVILALLLGVCAAHAQQLVPIDPDWQEVDAPPAPPLKTDGLIPLEIPGSSLRFGIDPSSISIGKDGIVRYVVVAASSSGAVNGIYEGLRCSTGEVKVYARQNSGNGWTVAKDSLWRPLHEQPGSRHTLAIARNGACVGHGTSRSASEIARDLRAPVDTRFRGN